MVELAERNSRMKDFYDIWFLSRTFDFEGKRLAEAIAKAFERRGRAVPEVIEPLQPGILPALQPYWNAFVKTIKQDQVPDFDQIINAVQEFLQPVCTCIREGQEAGKWEAESHSWIKSSISG